MAPEIPKLLKVSQQSFCKTEAASHQNFFGPFLRIFLELFFSLLYLPKSFKLYFLCVD